MHASYVMSQANALWKAFSTREQALLIWILLGLTLVLAGEKTRQPLFALFEALFARKIVLYFGLFAVWAFGSVALLRWAEV